MEMLQKRLSKPATPISDVTATKAMRSHVLVDAHLRVLSTDNDADALFMVPNPELTIVDGFLRACSTHWQAQLQMALTAQSTNSGLRTLTSPSGRLRLEVRLLAGRRPRSASDALGLIIAITTDSAAGLPQLSTYYGLSRTEARILSALCNGTRVANYATSHGVSIQTVRKQMKGLFAKLGVHTQLEAARVVYQTLADESLAA